MLAPTWTREGLPLFAEVERSDWESREASLVLRQWFEPIEDEL